MPYPNKRSKAKKPAEYKYKHVKKMVKIQIALAGAIYKNLLLLSPDERKAKKNAPNKYIKAYEAIYEPLTEVEKAIINNILKTENEDIHLLVNLIGRIELTEKEFYEEMYRVLTTFHEKTEQLPMTSDLFSMSLEAGRATL